MVAGRLRPAPLPSGGLIMMREITGVPFFRTLAVAALLLAAGCGDDPKTPPATTPDADQPAADAAVPKDMAAPSDTAAPGDGGTADLAAGDVPAPGDGATADVPPAGDVPPG